MAALDRTLVKSLPLFQKMSDPELDSLLTRATVRRVPQNEAVFEQGATADFFFLLLHGRLKVTQVTKDGQQIIVRVVNPGDLFGFARALQRTDYPGTATAATESLVLAWPTELWNVFVEKNPSKIRSRCSAGMPPPVSRTLSVIAPRASHDVCTVISRRSAPAIEIAWMAFSNRFTTTC